MTKERLTIMIDPELRARLQALADADDRSLSEALTIATKLGLRLLEERVAAANAVVTL